MKNRAGLLIIVSAIMTTFITFFCGCNKNNSLSNEYADKFLQSYLTQHYVGKRENGSKVYLIGEYESGSRYLIIKKDGSFKQALAFGEVPEKKILESFQNKCFEIYKAPSYMTEGRAFFDQVEEIIDDDGTDCSWMPF